ncbi:hypothetical protein GUJ93_ZPchr0006g45251 [Zizania palustris]|uniref:CP12 domain-containing protein n=1 Tax=Zizania palustris TaxID=103762 RepID=A0A8J5SQV6_ZIZPA|nr:hypothetical protein GUJ93_ZPchr0006g45251 [Zizania palustris]
MRCYLYRSCRLSVCRFAKASCRSSTCRMRGGHSRAWWPRRPCASMPQAEETCAGDPVGGECSAAWDKVEELNATASHVRDRKKDNDLLEEYCKDNPETDECRTYED